MFFISVQPDEFDFVWQLEIQINNFRKWGISHLYKVLIYCPPERGISVTKEMKFLELCFPEVEFHYFFDPNDLCGRLIRGFQYIPLLRPWCLREYWKKHPEMEKETFMYLDCDVIFTEKPNFDEYLKDDVNYLSPTPYISSSYFQSKYDNPQNIKPLKLESFLKSDLLGELTEYVGISKKTVIENESVTGGAQYILKNIDPKFWSDVLDACLFIRLHTRAFNQRFFSGANPNEVENNGFQSWCADMWAVLWNLWKRGKITKTPNELDFTWGDAPIEKAEGRFIHHQAGRTEIIKDGVKHLLFDKRKADFITGGITPFDDKRYLDAISKDYCSILYVDAIKETISNRNRI